MPLRVGGFKPPPFPSHIPYSVEHPPMRVSYTPELVAHVRHRYENTDDTLAKIATDCGISERVFAALNAGYENQIRHRARQGNRTHTSRPAPRPLRCARRG